MKFKHRFVVVVEKQSLVSRTRSYRSFPHYSDAEKYSGQKNNFSNYSYIVDTDTTSVE